MRNFKISYIFFLLVIMVGCNDRDLNRDTVPEPVPSVPGFGDIQEITEPTQTYDIAIKYPLDYKREVFEELLGSHLDIVNIETCDWNEHMDIWTIEEESQQNLMRTLKYLFQRIIIWKDDGTHSNHTGGQSSHETYEVLIPPSNNAETHAQQLLQEIGQITDPVETRSIIIYFDGECRLIK